MPLQLLLSLLLLLHALPSALCLIVINQDGTKHLFSHMTASFGPRPGEYVASGPFIAASPLLACTPLQESSTTRFSGVIVFIPRGDCAFVDKVKNAQDAGAISVVVGDNHNSNPDYIQMGASDPEEAAKIVIPAVFVAYADAQVIFSSLPLNATLDQDGEVPVDQDYAMTSNLQTVGLLLLILPVLWCIIVAIYYIHKLYRERRDARLRAERSSHLPVLRYHRLEDRETPSEAPSEVHRSTCHNESCAICLEDFNSEVEVKVLPCSHGFHSQCINPWIDDRSDLCPICKRSILELSAAEARGFSLC